jgi:hypothetical protein
VLLPDFEPLLLTIGLVTIVTEVDETISHVKDVELDRDAL